MKHRAPAVLVFGGYDPSGGAGVLADVEAIRAMGAAPYAVITAVTAQGPSGVSRLSPLTPKLIAAQLQALGRVRYGAIKIGMVGNAANARALARLISVGSLIDLPVVLDPVLRASSDGSLYRGALEAFRPLLRRATIATPNWAELTALTSFAGARLRDDGAAISAARTLETQSVLIKGGHRRGAANDLWVRADSTRVFKGKRLRGTARGTGCRLASAIAAELAKGASLEAAIAHGKQYVRAYLRAHS